MTPTKGIVSSRTDESISPPRSIPPKPLPRFNVKQTAFNDDDIIESDEYDNLYTGRELSSNISKSKESSQPERTTLSGIDPKRLERHMKNRPKSAALKKQSNKDKETQITDSSVDLRESINCITNNTSDKIFTIYQVIFRKHLYIKFFRIL